MVREKSLAIVLLVPFEACLVRSVNIPLASTVIDRCRNLEKGLYGQIYPNLYSCAHVFRTVKNENG